MPHHQSPSAQIVTIERALLRVLCCGEATAQTWQDIMLSLKNHSWADAENHVVYHALARMTSRHGSASRGQLAAEATRMGFPDVEWDNYFEAEGRGSPGMLSIGELVKALKDIS
jgi:hypothetical protein